ADDPEMREGRAEQARGGRRLLIQEIPGGLPGGSREKTAGRAVGGQEGLDLATQRRVAAAGRVEKRGKLRRREVQRLADDLRDASPALAIDRRFDRHPA